MIIGLTGGIASGKTTVADMFIELGVDVVDADIVARDVVAKGTQALSLIHQHFGHDVLLATGELNRVFLRQVIFSNPVEKQWLNDLLHPLIRQKIIDDLAQCQSPYCILVAPLLIENSMQTMVDHILVIDVDESIQIERTITRDNCTIEQAKAILAAQISRDLRLDQANDVIKNTGMINKLTNDVKKLHDRYSKIVQEGS